MNNIYEELSKAMMNGSAFFKEAESFGFSMKHIDLFDKQAKRNFDTLANQIMNTCAILPYSRDFVKTDFKINISEAAHFCDCIVGKNAGNPILTLPIEKCAMPMFDGATMFQYNGDKRTITASKIILFRTDLSYSALSLVHENTHILFNNPAPEKGFHIHYNELLPILMELIATSRFKHTLHDPNLFKHYLDIRIKTLRDHLEEYSKGLILRQVGTKDLIPFEYSLHVSYSYIIGTIYALRLFELYKEEPESTVEEIKKAITHQITIEDMLMRTNVSLKDKSTIKATEKVLKMYQR